MKERVLWRILKFEIVQEWLSEWGQVLNNGKGTYFVQMAVWLFRRRLL